MHEIPTGAAPSQGTAPPGPRPTIPSPPQPFDTAEYARTVASDVRAVHGAQVVGDASAADGVSGATILQFVFQAVDEPRVVLVYLSHAPQSSNGRLWGSANAISYKSCGYVNSEERTVRHADDVFALAVRAAFKFSC